MQAPSDNLVRAYIAPDAVEIRASDGTGPDILTGHFAVFNEWTTINSRFEGHFLERIAPGAFARTLEERADRIKVLYDHGRDPSVGNKPLGVPVNLAEDDRGVRYDVEMFDAGYVNDLKPAIRAGALGSSFRFSVRAQGDSWDQPARATDWNPDRLPERTITDADVFEFGPVTFPAYDGATAGMRSVTDDLFSDLRYVAALTDRYGLSVVEKMLAGLPDDVRGLDMQVERGDTADDLPLATRRAWMASRFYA